MKTKQNKEKYNEACLKVFKMLELFSVDGTADYDNIIELFTKDDSTNSAAPVQLNKFLNTLKIFGINIKKTKNKYYLQNHFFTLNLTPEDIKALELLKNTSEILSNTKQKNAFEMFIKNIEMRLPSDLRELPSLSQNNSNFNPNEHFLKHKELISKCEKYCYENQKLEVCFNLDEKEYKVICNPREITYKNQKAYLCVFNNLSRQIFNVPLDKIISIKQLPLISKGQEISMTVVYKIRNNLAKAYKLKEWETTDGKFDQDGWLTIINHNEDFDDLTKRLMRYDYNCKVVSPKNFKERMITAIEETLANYE